MTGLPSTIPGEETFACHSCGRDTVVRDVKQPYIGGCILCGNLQDLPKAAPPGAGSHSGAGLPARREHSPGGVFPLSPRRAFSIRIPAKGGGGPFGDGGRKASGLSGAVKAAKPTATAVNRALHCVAGHTGENRTGSAGYLFREPTAKAAVGSIPTSPAFSFYLGRVAALSGAVERITPRKTEAASGGPSKYPSHSQSARPARHVPFGDILAGLALVAFTAVAMWLPEIIRWIG